MDLPSAPDVSPGSKRTGRPEAPGGAKVAVIPLSPLRGWFVPPPGSPGLAPGATRFRPSGAAENPSRDFRLGLLAAGE